MILGFRGLSYTIFDLNGKPKELFPTGKSPEPSVTKLSDNSFVLGKDFQSFVMDTKGELVQHNPIKWSDAPSTIGMQNKLYFLISLFFLSLKLQLTRFLY